MCNGPLIIEVPPNVKIIWVVCESCNVIVDYYYPPKTIKKLLVRE